MNEDPELSADRVPGDQSARGRRWSRAPGGRASRLELYVVAAIVLVLGFGSVGGAIVITSNDPGSNAAATTTTAAPPTTVEVPVTVPPTAAVAPTTTEAPPPAPPPTVASSSTYVETYAPPVTLPAGGPSGVSCTVPDVVTALGTFSDPMAVYSKFSALIRASGCMTPTSTSCIDPSVPAGMISEFSQNPAPGTVIDSRAIWYHTAHWSAQAAANWPAGSTFAQC